MNDIENFRDPRGRELDIRAVSSLQVKATLEKIAAGLVPGGEGWTEQDQIALDASNNVRTKDSLSAGDVLYTRDGRKMGNARIISSEFNDRLNCEVFTIRTDFGNTARLTAYEIADWFWAYRPEFDADGAGFAELPYFAPSMLGGEGLVGLTNTIDGVFVIVTDAQDGTSYPRPGHAVNIAFHRADNGEDLHVGIDAVDFHDADSCIKAALRFLQKRVQVQDRVDIGEGEPDMRHVKVSANDIGFAFGISRVEVPTAIQEKGADSIRAYLRSQLESAAVAAPALSFSMTYGQPLP